MTAIPGIPIKNLESMNFHPIAVSSITVS
jgi:hypothetical protein